jgi:AcrR family transcriptional regulator
VAERAGVGAVAGVAGPGPGSAGTGGVGRVGRPRSSAADAAILAAALDLCAEGGFDAVTMEAVAARAGVGKATVYRRHPSRVELLLAAVRSVVGTDDPDADTGDVAADLRILGRRYATLIGAEPLRSVVPQVLAAGVYDPELRAAHRRFVQGRRQRVVDAVRRGVERGELVAGTDPEFVADLVGGPIFHRTINLGGHLDDDGIARIVHSALLAFRA